MLLQINLQQEIAIIFIRTYSTSGLGCSPVVDICRNEADKNRIYRSVRVGARCRAGRKTFGGSPDRA